MARIYKVGSVGWAIRASGTLRDALSWWDGARWCVDGVARPEVMRLIIKMWCPETLGMLEKLDEHWVFVGKLYGRNK